MKEMIFPSALDHLKNITEEAVLLCVEMGPLGSWVTLTLRDLIDPERSCATGVTIFYEDQRVPCWLEIFSVLSNQRQLPTAGDLVVREQKNGEWTWLQAGGELAPFQFARKDARRGIPSIIDTPSQQIFDIRLLRELHQETEVRITHGIFFSGTATGQLGPYRLHLPSLYRHSSLGEWNLTGRPFRLICQLLPAEGELECFSCCTGRLGARCKLTPNRKLVISFYFTEQPAGTGLR